MNFDPQTESTKIISFIQDVFTKAHKSKAVIGVSGGLDSATSLFLTVQALGPEHVCAYFLPSKQTPKSSKTDVELAIRAVNLPSANFQTLPIASFIQKSWRLMHHNLELSTETNSSDQTVAKLRLANLSARIRMLLLFDQAKKLDALVVGTENLSETMLGYFTRFGDAASDLEPIAHLFKTQVVELANFLHVPESIITKPPSADLWSGQTDAKELGFTYEAADPILEQIRLGHQVEGELAQKILHQIEASHFKQLVPYRLDK